MKLSVAGTGYVGLVAGTCFAEYGNQVYCVDIEEEKIENLKKGILPIYEPGLEEMVIRNHKRGRLHFTTDLPHAIQKTDIVFIAVGTPGKADGRPDISNVLSVAEEVGRHANDYKIIVDKSTVPVGMADQVKSSAEKYAKHVIDVVSNPEFLREGLAIEDFMKPERVVIGTDSEKAADIMKSLYAPFVRETYSPILIMNIKSAELTKYACNSFLAMKITFANTIANLCDEVGADYNDVRIGMGTDTRIGKKFLHAGIGYGGSCFPKDVRALIQIAGDAGLDTPLIREVEESNNNQKLRICKKIEAYYKSRDSKKPLNGLKFAIWGLSFKPGTDDMREAPSISIINYLHNEGAEILASDPIAEKTSNVHFQGKIEFGEMYSILENADALLILTEWPMYREPDFERMKNLLKTPLIFDGRNIYDPRLMTDLGFEHYGIGIGN